MPAIWKQPAKQFMRQAAYQVSAGVGAGGAQGAHGGDSGVPQHSWASLGGIEGSSIGRGDFLFLSFLLGEERGSG